MTAVPCLVTRDLGVYLDAQDRAEAAFEAAEASINRESPAQIAERISDFLTRHPHWGPAGWPDMGDAELVAAVQDDEELWHAIVTGDLS